MSSVAEAAEMLVMAVMAVNFDVRQLSMRAIEFYICAFQFYKHALEFYMRAQKLNTRLHKFYMRSLNFYMRALKFYKRTPKFYLRKEKLAEGGENNYIGEEKVIYIFLFSLYKL